MAVTDRSRLRYPVIADVAKPGEDVGRLAVDVDRLPKWRAVATGQERAGDILMGAWSGWQFQNTAAGGVDGSIVSAANSGGLSGDAFSGVGGTVPPRFSAGCGRGGGLGYSTPADSSTGWAFWNFQSPWISAAWGMWLRPASLVGTRAMLVDFRGQLSEFCGGLFYSGGKVGVAGPGGDVALSPLLSSTEFQWVTLAVDNRVSGSYDFAVYSNAGSMIFNDSGPYVGLGTVMGQSRWGRLDAGAPGALCFDVLACQQDRALHLPAL